MSQGEVARKHGVTRQAVGARIAKEGWTQDLKAAIKRETERKVAGIVASDDHVAKARKVEEEAAKRAELLVRHRMEWDFLRSYTSAAMARAAHVEDGKLVLATGDAYQEALRQMRFAKVATDTLRARQEAERAAFGLDEQGDDQYDDELSVEHAAIRLLQILNAAGEPV